LKANPRAIVLLDEIEKAHPNVLTVFLQVFDDGRITDPKVCCPLKPFLPSLCSPSQLGTIYCQGAVFIMTSNLGSGEIRAASPKLHKLVAMAEDQRERYHKAIGTFKKELYPVLKASFKRDEFLGRINQIVVFLPLNNQEVSNDKQS
jgi:ATP-dependent Clp protease ATP-binding subunit ClpB